MKKFIESTRNILCVLKEYYKYNLHICISYDNILKYRDIINEITGEKEGKKNVFLYWNRGFSCKCINRGSK